jgi:diguanylate cyclase (GGDEF)-like protein
VGELSVIDNTPASAFVIAAAPCRLLAVDEDTFWRLVRASHEFAGNLLVLLAERMRATNVKASEGEKQRREFEKAARVDGLTGLHNRRWLDTSLPRLIERQTRDRQPLAVAILDVDHFKSFNDIYGHNAGDHVLRTVASLIATKLRPLDLTARYGGEEFVVIFPDTDLSGAYTACERLRGIVATTHVQMPDGTELPPVTISLGVAQVEQGEQAEQVLKRADVALYRAKHNGRNRVEASVEDTPKPKSHRVPKPSRLLQRGCAYLPENEGIMRVKCEITVDLDDGAFELKVQNLSSPGEAIDYEQLMKVLQKVFEKWDSTAALSGSSADG